MLKGLAQVQVDDFSSSFFIHWYYHSIVENHQIGQALSALGEAVLAVSDHLFALNVP